MRKRFLSTIVVAIGRLAMSASSADFIPCNSDSWTSDDNAFLNAVVSVNSSEVRHLLVNGVDALHQDANGRSYLHHIANHDGLPSEIMHRIGRSTEIGERLVIARLLIEAGVPIGGRDEDGGTPLLYAARSADNDLVAVLLAAGADVNATNVKGHTPLMAAARRGDRLLIQLLIEWGAKVDVIDDDRNSAILHAAIADRVSNVLTLMDAGACIKILNQRGESIAWHAAQSKHSPLIVFLRLIKLGANLDQAAVDGSTPLMQAAGHRHDQVVQVLIDAGVNIAARDADGRTALHRAAGSYDAPTVETILTSMKTSSMNSGCTSVLKATLETSESHRLRSERIVGLLLGAGACVECIDERGETPLLVASRHATAEVVQQMVSGCNSSVQFQEAIRDAFELVIDRVDRDRDRILDMLTTAMNRLGKTRDSSERQKNRINRDK